MARMDIYDTHAHFGNDEAETAATLDRARAAGVTRLMAVGGSEELNAAAVFLGSEEASYVTGQAIAFDGGYTCV